MRTTERTLQPESARAGTDDSYQRLVQGPGEPHLERRDLGPRNGTAGQPRSILHFAQITDIHTVDSQSPGRFEFVQRYSGTSEIYHTVVPAYRPQETLHLHATAQMLRTLNSLSPSKQTGAGLGLVVVTGDIIDNTQRNELRWFIDLMQGGTVVPHSGGERYEGVEDVAWGDPNYWHPDPFPDIYKERWGFPEYPGLLDEAMQPFRSEGLRLPWVCLRGNHDAMILGTALPDPDYEALATGSMKAIALPPQFDPEHDLQQFVWKPEILLQGPKRPVTADEDRRNITRRSFVEAHLDAGGTPRGHGFTPQNREEGTAYYVYDAAPEVRMLMLDTTNPGGYYQGSMGVRQLGWLEQRLIEAHSRYENQDGSIVETDHPDKLVVICSHHDSTSLINTVGAGPAGPGEYDDLPRVLGPDVEALLQRFPNVILWINGHTHHNAVRPHLGRHAAGFWEVTTCSLLDWPCQARLFEIVDNGDESLSLLCTMLDYDASEFESGDGVERLAAIHRELAANDPHAGLHQPLLGGEPMDRNVELVLPSPFPLRTLDPVTAAPFTGSTE